MQRKIIHIDMDAFYASIEQRDDPSLRGKPVVVGHPRSERAVVAAASYEARRYGIHSAMPMVRAWRLCPDLVAVRPRFEKYREASRVIRLMFEEYTDRVEPLALDECFLDVTDDAKNIGSATWIAQELRARIMAELNLTASAGVAPVKFVAKLASDANKPDGLCVVPPERVLAFIHPMPLERLWGVGPATAERLRMMGLRTVRDVADADVDRLTRALGKKGVQLHRFAHGIDEREVVAHRVRKSYGIERTFTENLLDAGEIMTIVSAQLERLAMMLSKDDVRARCVTLKLRYDDFTTITRAHSVTLPTAMVDQLAPQVHALIREKTDAGERGVRLVGVSVSGLVRAEDDRDLQLRLEV